MIIRDKCKVKKWRINQKKERIHKSKIRSNIFSFQADVEKFINIFTLSQVKSKEIINFKKIILIRVNYV
jgi:hypothetical protein